MARCIEADGFKYYVVRNKETGQYFRGKGVNKWGKYYNQASIYRFKKHAENAVEEESRRGNPTEVVEIRIAETADVAPRAEVANKICCEIEEEIVAALESNYRALKEWDDGRCNDYILEMVNRIKGKIDALRGIEAFVEELKNKYVEGRNER